jgi:hypothetical protein
MIWICLDFITTVHHRSKSMQDCIITMDETMVCYHTPETKYTASSGWIPKGQPARAHTCQIKQMVMGSRLPGPHLFPHCPHGYLHQCHLHHQGRRQVPGELQEEEAHHSQAAMVVSLGQCASSHCRQCEGLDNGQGDPAVGVSAQEGLKNTYEALSGTSPTDNTATAFQQFFYWAEKCIWIGGNFVEKT